MSQNPQAETDKQTAEGAPATVTPSKKSMREAFATMKEYSPKAGSPAQAAATFDYKPSGGNPGAHAQSHVPPQQSNQAFIGAAPPGYRLVSPGYYYPNAPNYYMAPQLVYPGGFVNPMGMMPHPHAAQQHLHHAGQQPHHGASPANVGTPTGTGSPTTSPTSTTTGTESPVSSNASTPVASSTTPSTTTTATSAMMGYAATASAYTPSNAAAATTATPVANGQASPAATPATNVTAASLVVPAKDTKSTLAASGETPNLQPPIRKNTGKSTAAASTASPVTGSASSSPAPNGTASPAPEAAAAPAAAATPATETAKTPAGEKSTTPAVETAKPATTPAAAETKPVEEKKKPETAAAAAATTTAAPAKAETAKSSAAKTAEPAAKKAAAAAEPAKVPVSLKDSFEPNFEVEEPSPRKDAIVEPAKPATTATPTPAATTAATAATASTPTSVDATKEAAKGAAKETAAKDSSSAPSATTSTSSSAASTPASSVAATPSPAPFVPSYRTGGASSALAEMAKKNDAVSGPPPGALRTYSPDLLLSLMKAAKEAPAPHALQVALQKTTINSPGGRQAGKAGGGGKGGRSARGDKSASKGPPATAVRPQVEAGSIEEKSRKFRGILNKITPETFDRLVTAMLAIPIENLETLVALVDIIVDTAVRELKFCSMYANLCSDIAMQLPDFEVEGAGKKNFRVIILTRCQDLFSKRQSVAPVPADVTDPEQKQEWEFKQNKIRNNMLGLVKFVGELANTSVLAISIIPRILDELLKAKFGYDDLELFTILLTTSGKRFPESPKYVKDCRDWVSSFAARDKEQQDSEGTRIRYLMQDVIDLADSNWVPRSASSAAQGPKTLDEIRADIARKEKMLENELKSIAKQRGGRMVQPVPTKTPSRGPTYSIMQRDSNKDTPPRTPSSPSQGGRGKAGFASQSSSSGSFTPARGTNMSTPASAGLASPSTLSNTFASLSLADFDPNYLTASTSSAPADEDDVDILDDENGAETSGVFDPSEIDESIEEFLDSNVGEEVVELLADTGSNLEEACKYTVSRLLLKVLDLTQDTKRNWALGLLTLFINPDSGLADTEKTIVPGLIQTLAELDSIDMPRAPTFMGNILAECLKRKLFPPNCLNKVLSPLAAEGSNATRTCNVIVAMWSGIPASELPLLIKQSNFNISSWPIPDEKVPAAMKQVFETAESQIARGEDLFNVAFWAKANSPATLKSSEFILKVLQKLINDAKEANKVNVEDENIKSIVAIIASSPGPLQKTIAAKLCEAFGNKGVVQLGMSLFTLFVNSGFPRKVLTEAADSIDSILYAPAYAVWLKSTESAAASSSGSNKASSSKGGKSKGGKKKGK